MSANEAISMSKHASQLDQLARHIAANPHDMISLETLAEQINLSAAHFQKLFIQRFGLSPKVFQNQCRHFKLKDALRRGNPVLRAIFDSGYGSTSRVYGKANKMGMTSQGLWRRW